MKTVLVRTASPYPVVIGSGLMELVGSHVASLGRVSTAAVISDSHVFPLYGQTVLDSLKKAGLNAVHFVFPAGEEQKNGSTYLDILNYLSENRLTRSDLIVALGGGVVGDMAGFAAATYLRGIRFLQIPTTLLAAVDSSVGGKTAIDLPAGKNLAGAFHQPVLVLCDIDALRTLPEEIFRDGCAEVIKYGVLYDPTLFDHLTQFGPDFNREYVIARCVELKGQVVAQDEFDNGARQKLNLGHTIGHGVEARSHFSLSHGQAVAIGMAIVSRASGCPDAHRIVGLLRQFGLPVTTGFPVEDIYTYTLSDKKRSGGTVNLIVPKTIGCCEIVPTPVEHLKSFIEEGL